MVAIEEDNDLLVFWEHILRPVPAIANAALPFEDVFTSLVEDQLASHTQLSPRALASAQRELLRLLIGICGRPLLATFAAFRDAQGGNYRDFVALLQNAALDSFFGEFPELSRLAALCVKDWTDANGEFSSRWAHDREGLVGMFGDGAAGEIDDLDISLSDRHGGRTVMRVTFASGLKLIYKPRGMALEQSYFELLAWLNGHGSPLDFRVVKVLEKPGYGWAECIASEPLQNLNAARDYFLRAGALQCLLYVLHATDAHMGNLLASSSWPVLVDAECLLQPLGNSADSDATEEPIRLLLRAGLLPQPELFRGEDPDMSGLAGAGGQLTNFRVPVWDHVNSDAMSLRFVQAALLPQSNLPSLKGGQLELSGFTAEFLEGFQEMYRYLADRRQDLLAAGGPLARMFSCNARVLLGHTRYYMSVLSQSLRPRYLGDSALRSVMLRETLSRETPTPVPAVLEAETKALERLDIPYFTASARDGWLAAEGRILIPSYFDSAGEEVVRSRLTGLSADGLERQSSLLRIIFALSSVHSFRLTTKTGISILL